MSLLHLYGILSFRNVAAGFSFRWLSTFQRNALKLLFPVYTPVLVVHSRFVQSHETIVLYEQLHMNDLNASRDELCTHWFVRWYIYISSLSPWMAQWRAHPKVYFCLWLLVAWSQLVIEIRQNVNADVPLWKETRVELHLSFCFFSTYWNVSYSLEAPLSASVLVPNKQAYFKEVRAN